MTHSDLCTKTAEYFLKNQRNKTALFEYKSCVSEEEPDVLVFAYDEAILCEIKMSRSDFLADSKKTCRKKYKMYSWVEMEMSEDNAVKRAAIRFHQANPELYMIQKPHLGNRRYYVCLEGLLKKEEMPEGWGLIYYREKSDRFIVVKSSERFRTNMKCERNLLLHAMQRYASGVRIGIKQNTY